jgi:hypothetical protein
MFCLNDSRLEHGWTLQRNFLLIKEEFFDKFFINQFKENVDQGVYNDRCTS